MPKNILYIGPYKQQDSWGDLSRNFLNVLELCEHNVVSRPIYMSNTYTNDTTILENLTVSKYDIVIQHCLPIFFQKIPGVKNIGLCSFDLSIKCSDWPIRINEILDELWVCTSKELERLHKDGVTIPIKVLGTPLDISVYNKEYTQYKVAKRFNFYNVAEYSQALNLFTLYCAFYREFKIYENVGLILRITGIHPNQLIEEVQNVRKSLRLYKDDLLYNHIQFICEPLTKAEVYGLHQACDCFIDTSLYSSINLNLLDALCFNKPIIISHQNNYNDCIKNYYRGRLVATNKTPLLIQNPPLDYIYNGYNDCFQISIPELQNAMRSELTYKRPNTLNINKFSYNTIANRINEYINS